MFATWHFFRESEQDKLSQWYDHPYLLLRIRGNKDYLCKAVKPTLEKDVRLILGNDGVVYCEVKEEPRYTEEGGYGTAGWLIAQKVFQCAAEAALFLIDYRSRNVALPNDFNEDKLVHCFLNQSLGQREIDFYIRRLRSLGVSLDPP